MKRPVLSRREYNHALKTMLAALPGLSPEQYAATLASQYPKNSASARRELHFRGLAAPELPAREYNEADIDLMADVLGALGYHTADSEMAWAHNLGLTEYREQEALA